MTPRADLAPLARILAGVVVVAGAVGAAGAVSGTAGWGTAGSSAAAPLAEPSTAPAMAEVGGPRGRGVRGGAVAPGIRAPVVSPVGPGGGQVSPAPSSGARWTWPLDPRPRVARPFRAPASDWGAGHRGLDLGIRAGATVVAVEAGQVRHAGVIAGRGTVSVEHADGLVSTYEPVRAGVAPGEWVAVGDALGVVVPGGASHCGVVACLHLGARRAGAYLDPWPLLAGGEIALLPLG